MNKIIIENLRRKYPKDTRIQLVFMDDVQAPPVGTCGTVLGIDDMGNVLVKWDNGSMLNVLYGIDKISIVSLPDVKSDNV